MLMKQGGYFWRRWICGIDCGDGLMDIYLSPNSTRCILNMYSFCVSKKDQIIGGKKREKFKVIDYNHITGCRNEYCSLSSFFLRYTYSYLFKLILCLVSYSFPCFQMGDFCSGLLLLLSVCLWDIEAEPELEG